MAIGNNEEGKWGLCIALRYAKAIASLSDDMQPVVGGISRRIGVSNQAVRAPIPRQWRISCNCSELGFFPSLFPWFAAKTVVYVVC